MTVVAGWFAGRLYHDSVPGTAELNPTVLQEIKLNCAMNSKVRAPQVSAGKAVFVNLGWQPGSLIAYTSHQLKGVC